MAEAEAHIGPLDTSPTVGGRPEVGPPPGSHLAEAVVATVAGLLEAETDQQLLDTVVDLVASCDARVDGSTSDPVAALRTLPDDLRALGGLDLTLGPVVRALCAAALERASGGLQPPRVDESAVVTPLSGDRQQALISFDLWDLGAVRAELGDPGTRWLLEKLQRTLRTLLRGDDRALRYPANRFIVLLRRTPPERGRLFAGRLAWEWQCYLGSSGRVVTHVEEIVDDDVAGALRRLV